MLITTPMPFPYVHLCKVMLVCMLLTMPLATDASDGFFSTVFMPGVLAFSLLGIDAIATELSDPFGTDCNDLDVTGRAAALESECLMFLDLCGDPGAIQAFQTYTLNSEDIPVDDARCPTEFLCLRREVSFGAKVGQNSSVVCATSATASLFGARLGEATKRPSTQTQNTKTAKIRKDPPRMRSPSRDEDDGGDDPRQPLLGMSQEQAGGSQVFRPMDTAGSSQAVFRPMEDLHSADSADLQEEDAAHHAQDVVGLSDSEGDEEAPSSAQGGGFVPLSGSVRMSSSPRKGGAARVRGASSLTSSARFRLPDDARSSPASRSPGGFRPMDEMGTQTIHFSEPELETGAGPDVVGLSDGEDEDHAIPEEDRDEDEQDEEQGGGGASTLASPAPALTSSQASLGLSHSGRRSPDS